MNVILGGGITSLIWGYYHPDHVILTDQIGGQMTHKFDLGPRYLHNKSKKVEKFLKDLDVPLKLSTIRVGYVDDSGFTDHPTEEFRKNYFRKSRDQITVKHLDSTVLNTNIKEFQVFDINFRDLVLKLFEALYDRIYMGRATTINIEKHLITTDTNMFLKYEKLVSTIPLNIFSMISGLELELKAVDVVYCLLPEDCLDLREFDFIYDARSETPFHRLSKCKQGIVCDVLSSRFECFKKYNYEKICDKISDESMCLVKNNQIISFEKDFKLEDRSIKFIGRYGAWNRRWKTETVIEEAQYE